MREELKRVNDDIYSDVIRSGRRTYFFDIKEKCNAEKYIVITESRRKSEEDGNVQFCKSKIFIYKEDFDKVKNQLKKMFDVINELEQRAEVEVSDIDKEFDEL